MGGPGSGRWFRLETAKDTVEECSIIDVSWLRVHGVIAWDDTNEGTFRARGRGGSLSFHLADNQLRLQHRGQDYSVPLTRTFPKFGGHRLWFLCPRCSARVGKLYLAPGHARYKCRKCSNLTYQSTRDISLAEATKIAETPISEEMSISEAMRALKAGVRLERAYRR